MPNFLKNEYFLPPNTHTPFCLITDVPCLDRVIKKDWENIKIAPSLSLMYGNNYSAVKTVIKKTTR